MTPILTHLAAAFVGGAIWSGLVLIVCHWLNTLADRNEVDDGTPQRVVRTSLLRSTGSDGCKARRA